MPGSHGLLGDMVEYAAVTIGDDLPLQLQLKVLVVRSRDDVITPASALPSCTAFHPDQLAVDRRPPGSHFVHLVTAPTGGGSAVEQQLPTGLLLGVTQGIRFGGLEDQV